MSLQQEVAENKVKQLKQWASELTRQELNIDELYDSSLSFEQNQERIRQEIKRLESIVKSEGDVNEYNKETYEKNDTIDKYFKPLKNGIDKIVQGYTNLVFVKGRGGIGKSSQIERYLRDSGAMAIPPSAMNSNELNVPIITHLDKDKDYYLEVTGEVSEAYLYRILYVFNGTILWFRDINKIFKTLKNIDTLKAATETKHKRLLCNNNYSVRSQDLPRQFVYDGRIIFDFNSLEGLSFKEDFEALLTRGDYIDVSLSREDIQEIMTSLANDDWKKEVTRFLIDNYETTGWDLLNLRTQWKAFNTYEYCQKNKKEWKSELKMELTSNMSKVRSLLYSLIGRKPIRAIELKKLLLKRGEVNSIRTAHRRIEEWLEIGEIHKISSDTKNYLVCIDNIRTT